MKMRLQVLLLAALALCGCSAQTQPQIGSVSGNTYTNEFFRFRVTIPNGWVVLDAQPTGIRLSVKEPTTLLFVSSAAPSSGDAMPRHILALKLVADDVSSVHDIRNGRDVLDKMVSILKSTTPPHEVTAEPSTVKHGTTEFSRVYYKQTFPGVTHFYCTEATVLKGYALRVSAIADSQAEADEACAMANTLEFY